MSDFLFRVLADAAEAKETIKGVEEELDGLKEKGEEGLSLKGLSIAAAGGQAIVGSITELASSINEAVEATNRLEDQFTELSNKAQKFAVDGRTVNQVLSEQIEISGALHTTAAKSIEIYDGVIDATDNLNLSLEDQKLLTETLGQSAILAGRSVESAGSSLTGLATAWQTGADAGRQLRGFFKENHDLAVELEKVFGESQKEIIEGVKSGKHTYEDFANAIIQAHGGMAESFSKIEKTHKDWEEQFEEANLMAIKSGESFADSYIFALNRANDEIAKNGKTVGQWADEINRKLDKIKKDSEQDPFGKLIDAFDNVKKSGGELINNMGDHWDPKLRNFIDGMKKWGEHAQKNAEHTKKLREEWEKYQETLLKTDLSALQKGSTGIGSDKGLEGLKNQADELVAITKGLEENTKRAAEERAKADEERIKKTASLQAEANKKEAEDLQKIAEKAGELGANLVEAALKGKESFADAVNNMLIDLTKVIVKALITKAITSAIGGDIAGAATGGGLTGAIGSLFGFANGGRFMAGYAGGDQFMVGGSGGTDSNLVAFRASPNERVTVETPGDIASGRYFGGGSGPTNVVVMNDPREIVSGLRTAPGQAEFIRLNRQFNRRN